MTKWRTAIAFYFFYICFFMKLEKLRSLLLSWGVMKKVLDYEIIKDENKINVGFNSHCYPTRANVWSNFLVGFFFHRVMFREIYARLKPSKILASPVQNPDKWPLGGRGGTRKNLLCPYPLILILLAPRIVLEYYAINFKEDELLLQRNFSTHPKDVHNQYY